MSGSTVISSIWLLVHHLVMVSLDEITEPPAIRHLNEGNLNQLKSNALKLMHPCHNQAVERHVKLISEASLQVTLFERREGNIRQKIRSRKLLKQLITKSQAGESAIKCLSQGHNRMARVGFESRPC